MKAAAVRAARGLYWSLAPWWLRERVQSWRIRRARRHVDASLGPWIERERSRAALRNRGHAVARAVAIDWFDDAAVARGCGIDPAMWLCPEPESSAVRTRAAATCYVVHLWRRRPDLRARFPGALTDGGDSPFTQWLVAHGANELRLDTHAVKCLLDVFTDRPSLRARQVFMSNLTLANVLPHGLTPVGACELFRWFVLVGCAQAGMEIGQIWWLMLEAAQQPAKELQRAWCFAPHWQARHPDGLTVFGCEAFAQWFASEYGAEGAWVSPETWPPHHRPVEQLRLAYRARADWQHAHPNALVDATHARLLIEWLCSPASGLTEIQQEWCQGLDTFIVADELARPGCNVLGHFCYPSGLRISVESMAQAMRLAHVPVSLRDMITDSKDDSHHSEFDGMEVYDTTIVHIQPEPYFEAAYERAQLAPRSPRPYRVAYWYWEFDSIPDAWVEKAKGVDEVWAATQFVAKGLRERLSVPVRTLFPGVKLASFKRRNRAHFSLPEDRFIFLFTFHMMSVMERKNPLGLIRAFKEAFDPGERACLVLKTSYGERFPAQMQQLRAAAAGANIHVIDEVYSPSDVLALMHECDAYVSLHRSEGLGLTMAEAMLMGKPVIATNFSGNVDFMDDSNSLLVPYELARLGWPIPPYDANLEWAAPSEAHAAEHMRRLYLDPQGARELGLRAQTSAQLNLSLEAAGRRIAARLSEIDAMRRVQAGQARQSKL